jgi:hypothetical protein
MLKAKDLQARGVDPATAKKMEGLFSGMTLQQILAIIQAILAAVSGALPTNPTPPAPTP